MSPARAQDSDGDGLPDAVEGQLGTDKEFAEPLVTLGTYPAKSKEHPELDIVRVDFGNVARDRWLWAIRFGQPYSFANSNLIIYLDADNDPKTGRKDMGCEVMLSHHGGKPGVTAFTPDGSYASAPLPRVALVDGVLYFCHDLGIRQEGGKSTFRFTVLSETLEPHAGVDSTGWSEAAGPGNSDRKKIIFLDDITADENFETTEGLDLLWQLQADPANVVLSSVEGELSGMAYYDTEYRWPAVRGSDGTITVTVPKAGKFYPAVVVYDTPGRECYAMELAGRRLGRFLAAEDDNRQRIHFLSEPVEFRGGEKLIVRVGSAGSHITEDILLLAVRPPVRKRTFEIRQIEAGYVSRPDGDAMRLTWITTWPAACTVEYGPTADYGQKVSEPEPLANHRLAIAGLPPGQAVHFRVVAPRPDGTAAASPDQVFTFQAPAVPAGSARHERVELKVDNPYEFALGSYPVTSGVPFAKREMADALHVRLLDPQGQPLALQSKVAGRWPDGSVKWILISFLAEVPAATTAGYVLEYGSEVRPPSVATPLIASREKNVLKMDTGPLRVEFDSQRGGFPTRMLVDANGDGALADDEDMLAGRPIQAEVLGPAGQRYSSAGPVETIEVEESGPIRAVVKVTGHHTAGEKRFFASVNRFTFYAGKPWVGVDYTWVNDSDAAPFATFEGITLNVPVQGAADAGWTLGLGNGAKSSGRGEVALRQLRDDTFDLAPAPPEDRRTNNVRTPRRMDLQVRPQDAVRGDGPGGPSYGTSFSAGPEGAKTRRADGWIDLSGARFGLTAAVRDFWQLYPKGLRATGEGLALDLAADFPEGTYDGCSKLDEIKLYYYLMGGRYKVAQGVQKQHQVMLYAHRGGFDAAAEQAARVFQEPPIAVCPPERYCDTLVFGEILPATAGRTPEYEKVCENVYQGYLRHREGSHEYGMLNFGDVWGERRVNWANGEYDHHHAFLMQFIRSGDRRWYFLGERAARHAIDVDTCHAGPRRGGEWIHSMGHTGGYFTEPYEDSGIPGPGMSVSHTWTEGFCDWHFLSGDPTAAENAVLVADHYDGACLNDYDWGNCRTNGWHLLLTVAAYRMTGDPFYLNAARIIVERTLERQSPGGGWHRQMVPGHCLDMPRHRGEANFMLGVLANGLEEYYREVPDPRVKEAILGGARQAVRELWVDESSGFRYTSCPNMKGYTANNDMTSEILFFAYRLGGDRPFADIALRAMRAQFADGIGSIAHLRWTPHLIYNIDLLRQEGQRTQER